MTWPTHALLGINSLWLLAPLPPELLAYDLGTLAACATLGALLPDLDASESKIKHLKLPGTQFKPFLLPAQVVSRTDQHRGLLHSLWGLGMATFVLIPAAVLIGWAPIVALLLGYISHLLGDSATKSGIRLLYPRKLRFHLLPPHLRLTTGSQAEDVVAALMVLPVLLLLLSNFYV